MLSLGDFRAVASRCLTFRDLKEVEEQAGTDRESDETPLVSVFTEIGEVMREKFPLPNSAGVPTLPWKSDQTPREDLDNCKEAWEKITGCHPGKRGLQQEWFRQAVMEGVPRSVKDAMMANPDLPGSSSAESDKRSSAYLRDKENPGGPQRGRLSLKRRREWPILTEINSPAGVESSMSGGTGGSPSGPVLPSRSRVGERPLVPVGLLRTKKLPGPSNLCRERVITPRKQLCDYDSEDDFHPAKRLRAAPARTAKKKKEEQKKKTVEDRDSGSAATLLLDKEIKLWVLEWAEETAAATHFLEQQGELQFTRPQVEEDTTAWPLHLQEDSAASDSTRGEQEDAAVCFPTINFDDLSLYNQDTTPPVEAVRERSLLYTPNVTPPTPPPVDPVWKGGKQLSMLKLLAGAAYTSDSETCSSSDSESNSDDCYSVASEISSVSALDIDSADVAPAGASDTSTQTDGDNTVLVNHAVLELWSYLCAAVKHIDTRHTRLEAYVLHALPVVTGYITDAQNLHATSLDKNGRV
ncbi:uncharacterized protein LOC113143106 [Mastacembelus armatus]|uniref:uncharacterized protein LOC113143106 n=1 Tax=Mastacembelus armatus TaxID=205130 RepID=UPI000E4630A8|nr:uncharacterized protein LOC113143106 [Mastacembelus armatus]